MFEMSVKDLNEDGRDSQQVNKIKEKRKNIFSYSSF